MNTLLWCIATSSPAFAEDPEFLLSDLAVRLDLDKARWHMTRWSTYDFEAKAEKDPILLSAWATPVQTPLKPAIEWGPLYEKIVTSKLQGNEPKVVRSELVDLKGTDWVFVDVTFQLPSVGAIALRGATTEIDGQNFHFTVVAPQRMDNVADRERDKIARKLEFTGKVPELEYGGKISNAQMTTKLPSGWRALHEGELDAVGQRILKFGVDDVTGCWVALRPRPSAEPDVMVTCPRPLHLGVVDELSLADNDLLVRTKFFGEGVPEGKALALTDRTGFLYAPRDGLAFAVIPDSDNVSVTWAIGEGRLDDQVLASLAPALFATPHAVDTNDRISHFITYQWTSPLVLCPVGCVGVGLIAIIGAGISAGRRRRADDDE